jgi:hypothetical protein
MGMCVSVPSVTPAAATAKNRNTVVIDTPEKAGEEADGMMVCVCVRVCVLGLLTFPEEIILLASENSREPSRIPENVWLTSMTDAVKSADAYSSINSPLELHATALSLL